MVANHNPNPDEADNQATDRAQDLMSEFRAHYQDCVEAHPELAGKPREIFEGWAIQKIAGLQLCVEHIAVQLNRHVEGKAAP